MDKYSEDNLQDATRCQLCNKLLMQQERIVRDCGHGSVCAGCLDEWQKLDHNCPTCGRRIKRVDTVEMIIGADGIA